MGQTAGKGIKGNGLAYAGRGGEIVLAFALNGESEQNGLQKGG